MFDPISRRTFFAITGAAFASSSLHASSPTVFPFGTHVYREPPLPLEQIAADLPLLKRLGFSMIKIQESWSTDEKHEGEIDLSRVERVVSDARQNGLLVYFGITMEQAPAWLWRKYPDASMVYEDGTPHNDPTQYLLPADGKPGPCWHHPEARRAGERFVETVGRTIGKYDNILVWNVFQEIGFWPLRPGHVGLCYCKYSLAEFRRWLQTRYQSLDDLNTKWRTDFGTWDELEPPRSFTQVPSFIDWRFFMDDVTLTGSLRWKAEAFRRSDPRRRRILAHTSSPVFGSTAEWQYARSLDVFGSSAYPSWGEPENPDLSSDDRVRHSQAPYEQLWSDVLMKFDYIRSASVNGEFWTAELEGGRAGGGVTPGRVPDPGDIRRWVLGCAATGARGICFWNHRSEPFWSEASGFGLLDRTGTSTPRAEEAGRLARALAAHGELFAKGEHPKPQIGIVVWERLWQFVSGTGSEVKDQYQASLRGIYKALWREGYTVDFVNAEQVPASGSEYKVLIAPAPICLSREIADNLRNYVKTGGVLISEACPGRFDEYGFNNIGEMAPGLAELFGATHKQLAAWTQPRIATQGGQNSWTLSGTGPVAGHEITATFYLQLLSLTTATPIFTHRGVPAGTVNQFGSGRAYLVGTFMGKPVLDSEGSGNQTAIAALVRAAGAAPQNSGKLLTRRRVLGTKSALFLVNPTHEDVQESVAVKGAQSVLDLLSGSVPVRNGTVDVRVPPLDIVCLILDQRA